MMSLFWILAVLLLFLTPDVFPSRSLTHAVPTSPPSTPHQIIYITGFGRNDYDDDYSEREDPPPSPSSHGGSSPTTTLDPNPPRPCAYDPCLEEQVPCAQLTAQDGCLCPGLSRGNEIPHPPHLQKLVPASDGAKGVEVQWCAPDSVVSGYLVVVGGGQGREPLKFGEEQRRGVLGELEVGTTVCVEAVNKAGNSEPVSEYSCKTYDPPEHPNLALRAGVIGGGLGFLLILSLAAIILWRHQSCGKAVKDSTEGLGNPSYSTEGTL